ncbi:MAG: RNA 2'-phosphotransferase [Hyphomonas sp.]
MTDKAISKRLSLILRHQPEKAGLTLGGGGWLPVADLLEGLASIGWGITEADLRRVVETNDKKRFTLSEDGLMIRAAQGHSVDFVSDLLPITPPEILFHGTATRFLDAILTEGLKRMSRQHVHLSADAETAARVGQRHGKPVILTVAAAKMHADGHAFFQADNGVWLTDHIPPRYLTAA